MRKYIRHPSDVPIEIELGDVVASRTEYLRDISRGGLCFRSKIPLATDTVIRIRVPLVRPVFEAEGKVIWCKASTDHFDVGVEFLKRSDLFRARMVEQVCYIEHYRNEIRKVEGRELTGEEAALEWIKRYASEFPHLEEGGES